MPQLQTQFITCPKCQGSGQDPDNEANVCRNCGQISTGTFIKNDFLYWGYNLTPAKIVIRQSQIIFDKAIDFLLLVLFFAGFLSFFYWVANNAVSDSYQIYTGRLLTFWSEKEISLLFFWFGLLALLFLFFRFFRKKEKYPSVKNLKYWQYQKFLRVKQNIPNNWRELRSFRTKLDVAKSYGDELLKIMEEAYFLAVNLQHAEIMPIHIVLALFQDNPGKKSNRQKKIIQSLFARLDLHQGKFIPKINEALHLLPQTKKISNKPKISKEVRQSLIEGYLIARDNGHEHIHILDLLVPLLNNDGTLRSVIKNLQLNIDSIENSIAWFLMQDKALMAKYHNHGGKYLNLQKKTRLVASAVATPVLEHFTIDLTEKARQEHKEIFIGRRELEDIFQFFFVGKKQVVLSGDEGVGKSFIISAVAEKIINDDVPKALRQKRLLLLDNEKIKNEGLNIAIDKKILIILQEARIDKNVILCVKDVEEKIWQILSEYASDILLIATSARQGVNFAGAQVVEVERPNTNSLIKMLAAESIGIEEKYKVYFYYQALEAALYAAQKYFAETNAVEKGKEILTQAAIDISRQTSRYINGAFVAKTVSALIGEPYTKILK